MKIYNVLTIFIFLFFVSCSKKQTESKNGNVKNEVVYASGLEIENHNNFTILKVTKPWPNAKKGFTYVCAKNKNLIPDSLKSFQFVKIPLENVVVTSTTHISSLVNLNEERELVGFPHTSYISSTNVRNLIADGKVVDLGENENLNFEKTIDLKPNAIIALSIDNNLGKFNQFEKGGIPIIFNADWVETTPLGKAEWIKFFGVLFDKQKQANSFFNNVVNEYEKAKKSVQKITKKPTVISGGLYQDVWYAPQGESWMASFIKDAKGTYVWADTKGTGSLSLSLEAAMDKGLNAEVWIGPSSFKSYEEMVSATKHYNKFKAFNNKQIFSYSIKVGATNGVLFYEDAPNRPDLVLKDFIHILHPEVLKNYEPSFLEPLK